MSKRKKITFWVFAILSIALTAFIFSNSLRAGEESSAQSDIVTDLANKLLGSFGISIEPQELSHFIRKLAHFSEYFALGLTSAVTLSVFKKRFYMIFSPIYCVIIAICDEFIMQAMTIGRAPMWKDVLIDSTGALTALIAVTVFLFIRKEKRYEK